MKEKFAVHARSEDWVLGMMLATLLYWGSEFRGAIRDDSYFPVLRSCSEPIRILKNHRVVGVGDPNHLRLVWIYMDEM